MPSRDSLRQPHLKQRSIQCSIHFINASGQKAEREPSSSTCQSFNFTFCLSFYTFPFSSTFDQTTTYFSSYHSWRILLSLSPPLIVFCHSKTLLPLPPSLHHLCTLTSSPSHLTPTAASAASCKTNLVRLRQPINHSS